MFLSYQVYYVSGAMFLVQCFWCNVSGAMMNGRDLISKRFRLLLVAAVLATGVTLTGLYSDSIPLMIAGAGFIWLLSRYGLTTMRCPFCGASLYKHLFKEASVWSSWIAWSKNLNEECPYCKTRFSDQV